MLEKNNKFINPNYITITRGGLILKVLIHLLINLDHPFYPAMAKPDKLLKEWANKVKDRDDRQCVICGKEKLLNAHHLIPKQVPEYKYQMRNGISLCPSHHRFSFILSAHQNPISFLKWMEANRPKQLEWVLEQCKI